MLKQRACFMIAIGKSMLIKEKNMALEKEKLIKDILSLRRRVDMKKGEGVREIEIFEEQYEKALRRVERDRYLAKKFNQEELQATIAAYEAILK